MPRALVLVMLFVLGSIAGSIINLAAYALAWRPRALSPWSPMPPGRLSRPFRHRVPILGWLARRDESKHFGRGFWIRPFVVELLCGLVFAALYEWESSQRFLHFVLPGAPRPPQELLSENVWLVMHARYAMHLILFSLMLAASLIDLDEKTIPDAITVPGAWLGLLAATIYPWSMLPAGEWPQLGGRATEFLTLVSPDGWNDTLRGWPPGWPLLAALGCWSLWCGGLLPRRLRMRRGWRMAVRIFWHRIVVERFSYWVTAAWLVGTLTIVSTAALANRAQWAGLFTSLVGLAVGGGLIWVVRLVGTLALRREAMGFGDVTLMSMIGAFLGWQAALMVFFMAPFIGLITGVIQWVLHGEREIPYGPYLCLATAWVVVSWSSLWAQFAYIFLLGWVIGAILGVCMVLMGLMLLAYRLLLGRLAGR